jgi:hypothetical protein
MTTSDFNRDIIQRTKMDGLLKLIQEKNNQIEALKYELNNNIQKNQDKNEISEISEKNMIYEETSTQKEMVNKNKIELNFSNCSSSSLSNANFSNDTNTFENNSEKELSLSLSSPRRSRHDSLPDSGISITHELNNFPKKKRTSSIPKPIRNNKINLEAISLEINSNLSKHELLEIIQSLNDKIFDLNMKLEGIFRKII